MRLIVGKKENTSNSAVYIMANDCKYRETSRMGLYILVFLLLLQTCEINEGSKRIEERLGKIESMLEK
jgi:hypothetical protein